MSFASYLLLSRHVYAYQQALQLGPRGGVALDVACGFGYALGELAQGRAATVVLDLSEQPLRQLDTPADIVKLQADATRLPVADRSISLLVAFQVIEHVPRSVAAAILREARRVLAPRGRAFLTTPNARWRLLPGQKPWNPYHLFEYQPKDIRGLCAEADLAEDAIKGVIGTELALRVERERVWQDPLEVYGGRAGASVRKILDRVQGWPRSKASAIAPADATETAWFSLGANYEDGLDFWIEIEG